ncbi:glyoxalase [Acidiluteibacter ferrifornacis]|uniref:Glyoxalase n=1 Tax=Acidiluteibacter ferrifornacis TaxID=2692424 RepID=A0A6N9NID9_9FLAO|nr:glyoxalase [Acidiluteibacter ferrifornacis]NBG64967.1 glyoxalase [Acidiluteibacter ferrifornacis]
MELLTKHSDDVSCFNTMKERDELLMDIRIELELPIENSKSLEVFQSNTLRPLMKFQNILILDIYKDYINRTQRSFSAFNQKVQLEIIKDSVTKDQRLKNQMIHIVVALFTIEEFNYYIKNFSELNKRIVSMTIQRLQDQLSRLIL